MCFEFSKRLKIHDSVFIFFKSCKTEKKKKVDKTKDTVVLKKLLFHNQNNENETEKASRLQSLATDYGN
jgi:hypothetical protein